MTVLSGLDAAGRHRSPATLPGHPAGRPPCNNGMRPADPPAIDEVVAVMRPTADDRHGSRGRATIVVFWRGRPRLPEPAPPPPAVFPPPRRGTVVPPGQGGARPPHREGPGG